MRTRETREYLRVLRFCAGRKSYYSSFSICCHGCVLCWYLREVFSQSLARNLFFFLSHCRPVVLVSKVCVLNLFIAVHGEATLFDSRKNNYEKLTFAYYCWLILKGIWQRTREGTDRDRTSLPLGWPLWVAGLHDLFAGAVGHLQPSLDVLETCHHCHVAFLICWHCKAVPFWNCLEERAGICLHCLLRHHMPSHTVACLRSYSI